MLRCKKHVGLVVWGSGVGKWILFYAKSHTHTEQQTLQLSEKRRQCEGTSSHFFSRVCMRYSENLFGNGRQNSKPVYWIRFDHLRLVQCNLFANSDLTVVRVFFVFFSFWGISDSRGTSIEGGEEDEDENEEAIGLHSSPSILKMVVEFEWTQSTQNPEHKIQKHFSRSKVNGLVL